MKICDRVQCGEKAVTTIHFKPDEQSFDLCGECKEKLFELLGKRVVRRKKDGRKREAVKS